jgi:hypothetical protein
VFADNRQQNLEWIESLVQRNEGKLTPLEFISQFCVMSGLRKETVQEYLKTLLLAKRLCLESGKIYTSSYLRKRNQATE